MNNNKNMFVNKKGRFSLFTIFDTKVFPIFSLCVLAAILGFFVYKYVQNKPFHKARTIIIDLEVLARVLHVIDESCSILSVKYDHTKIDFLNTVAFEGSEIGGLNLAYPRQWKKSFLKDNPTVEGIEYELVRAKDGFYVMPGQGLRLPNDLVMGKDIIIDRSVAVMPLLKEGGPLFYQNMPLAKKIDFIIGDWPSPKERQEKDRDIEETLKEHGSAMQFTMR